VLRLLAVLEELLLVIEWLRRTEHKVSGCPRLSMIEGATHFFRDRLAPSQEEPSTNESNDDADKSTSVPPVHLLAHPDERTYDKNKNEKIESSFAVHVFAFLPLTRGTQRPSAPEMAPAATAVDTAVPVP